MNAQTHALQAAAKRLSRFDRRRTLGVVIATIGAVAASAGVISQPAAAGPGYTCPPGTYLSFTTEYSPPVTSVLVPDFNITYIGFGPVSGGHVTIGDGSTRLGNTTIDVLAVVGEAVTDAHWCKAGTAPTTPPTEPTTPTTPESSVAESTTTSVQIAPPTTPPGEVTTPTTAPATTTAGSVGQELPRTGTDSARALLTFGSLMMLMGGVLVLRSRRDVEFG